MANSTTIKRMINDERDDPIDPSTTAQTNQSTKQRLHIHRAQSPCRENEILYHDELRLVFEMKRSDIVGSAKYIKPLMHMMSSKPGVISILILIIFREFIDLDLVEYTQWLRILLVIIDIIGILIITTILLSVNREAWKNILKTFEFWFKLVCTLMAGGLELYTYRGGSINLRTKMITATMVIILLSVCDGIHTKRRWMPACLSGFAVVGYAYWSILFQFFPQEGLRDIVYVTGDIHFSSINALASIYRMMSLFLAKQCFNIVFRPGHSTLFVFPIVLRWTRNDTRQRT
eukprot:252761_1